MRDNVYIRGIEQELKAQAKRDSMVVLARDIELTFKENNMLTKTPEPITEGP